MINTHIKYFMYCRKSSESEDRQTQSINDQKNRLLELSADFGLTVKRTFTEARSAKNPNNRPAFTEMISQIERGEAEGILCWAIDRLSRNPVDSGKIQWLLQQGAIKSIRTIDKEHLPDDNALILSVEAGTANEYIRGLRKGVLRGMKSKIESGWLPNLPPTGYLNDKINKTIVNDPERFDLTRKMWELMLSGLCSVDQILDTANSKWGFRTRKMKKFGDRPLARSTLYKIFTNPFYAGLLTHAGKEYPGKHNKMVTLEEFDRVQTLLGKKGKPRHRKHEYPFTGMIHCGECGCLITAETKTKVLKKSRRVKEYVYYHCTRRKQDVDCNQRQSISQEELEKQFENELSKYTILPKFREWALEVLNEENEKELEERTKVHTNINRTIMKTQKELDGLTRMRYKDLITDEEFQRERKELKTTLDKLRRSLRETEHRTENWFKLTEKVFDLATYGKRAFIEGDAKTKRTILEALGQNFSLKDGQLSIEPNKWLVPIKESYPALEKEYLRLEPKKLPYTNEQTEGFTSVRTRWLRLVDDFRTLDWSKAFEFPELALENMRALVDTKI